MQWEGGAFDVAADSLAKLLDVFNDLSKGWVARSIAPPAQSHNLREEGSLLLIDEKDLQTHVLLCNCILLSNVRDSNQKKNALSTK